MSDYKNPRPSPSASASDPCVVYDNSVSFDKLINESQVVITYKGVELQSVPSLLEQIEAEANAAVNTVITEINTVITEITSLGLQAIESIGWYPVGEFATGFTYTKLNDVGRDSSGSWWRYNGSDLPKVIIAGTVPSSPNFSVISFETADNVSKRGGGSVQDFIDSFALKIFQSPTNGGLTEIQTRTVNANEVYEVRKVSDDSLATIYSDAAGTTEIVQNGTSNVSGSDGVVEFYIADGDYYVEVDSVKSNFGVDVLRQDLANHDKGAAMVARGVVAVDSIADLLALTEGQRKEGLRYLVKGYHSGSDVGGGEFYWDESITRPSHNGATVISPTVPWSSTSGYLTGAGETAPAGTGCWIKVFATKGEISALEFGAIEGDLSADAYSRSKIIVREAVSLGLRLTYPRGRFASMGIFVPTDPLDGLKITGAGRPSTNAARTRLDGATGTVFVGPIQVTGDFIELLDFGVDVGPERGGIDNGLIVNGRIGTTPAASVKHCVIKRISALCYAQESQIHGVLLQGIDGLEIDEIYTTYGFFGTVVKCQNVRGGTIYSEYNGATGFYAKSDVGATGGDTYSIAQNIDIERVMYVGYPLETGSVACEVFASSADTSNVTIGSVTVNGGGIGAKVHGLSGLANARGTTIGSVNCINVYQDVLMGDNTNGTSIGTINASSPRRGVIFESYETTIDAALGSIVGVVSGTKDVLNSEVVLRGEIIVGAINVTSDNTDPTVSLNSTTLCRVNSLVGLKMGYEGALSLVNGYAAYFEIPTIHDGSEGWWLSGRLDVTGATHNTIATLPSVIAASEATLIPVSCLESGAYSTTFLYINGSDLQWINRVGQPNVTWIDLSSVYVRFGQ